MILVDIFCVCLGGALGAILRSKIAIRFDSQKSGFPLGTFFANMLASLMLGVIVSLTARFNIPRFADLFLEIGFCATLSTFSSLAWQIAHMLRLSKYKLAASYAIATMFGGMLIFELAVNVF